MIEVVIVKAVAPAANAICGLILVARVRSKSASLSVSSAMKMVITTVKNGTTSEPISNVN